MQQRRGAVREEDVPHDLNAERAVLCQVMLNGRGDLHKALQILQPADFFSKKHRVIFEAMIAVAGMGASPSDPVLLVSWLKAHGNLDVVGGPAGLMSVLDAV